MKNIKIKFFLILFLVFIILFIILVNKNIIILNKGTIDGIRYLGTQTIKIKKEKIVSKISKIEKKYDELEICEKYTPAAINNSFYYNCNSKSIPDSLIDTYLDNITISSMDYIGNTFTQNANIYSIKNVSSNSAVAIKFENTNEYYTYINSVCMPITLKELFDNFNIDEYISYNSVQYTKKVFNKDIELETSEISSNDIKSILFNEININIENFYDNLDTQYFTIYTDSPVYGSEFVFKLSNNGFLIISIPSIRKDLVGSINKINEFSTYIKSNFITHAKITSYNLLPLF